MMRWCALLLLCRLAFAADETCAKCHQRETENFRHSPMANALFAAKDSEILKQHPTLEFQEGNYHSRITGTQLTVSDGTETLTTRLLWAFGRGQAGQTYVFERNGNFYESRVSFYNALGALDLTMGAQGSRPGSLEEASGRKMDSIGARDCFGCHSAGGVSAGKLHLETMSPGVGCENCHGPAAKHAAEMTKMPSLASLSAEEMSEMCGRCHRTWSQVALNGPRGVGNVRFQPYRLANSKCYDSADRRIRCTACHDPHAAVETRAAAYDAKCAACHSAAAHTKVCKVAKANCSTCHMPKIELPGSHARFTDHQIRVVRAGEAYPN